MTLERRTPTSHRAALAKLERLQAAIETARRRRAAAVGELARYAEQARHELSTAVPHVEARARTRDAVAPDAAPAAAVVTFPPLAAPPTAPATGRRWPWLLALAAVTATAIIGITGWPSTRSAPPEAAPAAPRESAPPEASSAPSPPARVPGGTAPAPAASRAAAADVPLRITLTASRHVWMRVIADGRRQLERELVPGETLTFTATRGILLRTGDAGGVRLTVNGADAGVLGGNYAVVSRAIDAPPASAR